MDALGRADETDPKAVWRACQPIVWPISMTLPHG
jgi:hypothetical protein